MKLRDIVTKLNLATAGHAPIDDATLIGWLQAEVLRPFRAVVGVAVAARWSDPHFRSVVAAFNDAETSIRCFDEALISRDDLLVTLKRVESELAAASRR